MKTTPKEWALHIIRAWSTSEEFPRHPFPGLVDAIELGITNAVAEVLHGKTPVETEGLQLIADYVSGKHFPEGCEPGEDCEHPTCRIYDTLEKAGFGVRR